MKNSPQQSLNMLQSEIVIGADDGKSLAAPNHRAHSVTKQFADKLDLAFIYFFFKLNRQLKRDGWFLSMRKGIPLDGSATPIPMLTYPFLKFLEKRINREMTVFEYGSGNSTLWWAKRVNRVVACEHDKGWFEKMSRDVPAHAEVKYVPLEREDYANFVKQYRNEFDVVVIDGRDRIKCAINSVPALKEGGVIIWDDTERDFYREGFRQLSELGYKQLEFEGLRPTRADYSITSIFYKEGNCFNL